MAGKGMPKSGGRQKGSKNKTTALIKDMIIQALDDAGGVEYLRSVAEENPAIFCTLVGKVLPMNHTSEDGSMSPPDVIEIVGLSGKT